MRRIILFRHGKAEAAHGGDDENRPLAPVGKGEASEAGQWMAAAGFEPDIVICSTALRARQTWKEAAAEFDPVPPLRYEPRIYDATVERLVEVLRELPSEVWTVLIVGHNPSLQGLVHELGAAGEPDVVERLAQGLPTAAVAVLEVEDRPWADLGDHEGWLFAVFTPDDAEEENVEDEADDEPAEEDDEWGWTKEDE